MKRSIGRYIFGVSAIGYGITDLIWRDFAGSDYLKTIHFPALAFLAIVLGIVQIFGGAAVLWPKADRAGAIVLCAVYAFLCLLAAPFVIQHPLSFNPWGNFFEIFSLLAASLILYSWAGAPVPQRAAAIGRFGYYAFAVAVITFGLEQAFYMAPTAGLVPKWILPGQMFWAYVTTIAFILAGIAMLAGVLPRVASALNTAMLLGFGLLVWVPILTVDPKNFANWGEGIETLAIAAAAWIATEYIGAIRRGNALR